MLDGILRLKFRKGYERPEMLPAGEIAELNIDLGDISLILNRSHRIVVHVSSSNYPRFEKNLRVARNTIYMSAEHPSALILPVRP